MSQIATKPAANDLWELRLYIAGKTAATQNAMTNLKRFCETYLAGRYKIEVVDLTKNPTLAAGDQILAIPTLVRKFPRPVRRIIGDLCCTERILVGIDLN